MKFWLLGTVAFHCTVSLKGFGDQLFDDRSCQQGWTLEMLLLLSQMPQVSGPEWGS